MVSEMGRVQGSAGSSATFLTLPNELLEEIIIHLDNASLLQLGLTCTDTNFIALSTFFKRNDIREPNDGWLVAYKTPPETLPAINAARWVKSLRQIHYYLNSGLERLMADVHDLNHLIGRMPEVDLVKLHFSLMDSWAISAQSRLLSRDEWMRDFTTLLDTIIDRGCAELHVTGGGAIKTLYQSDEPHGLPILEAQDNRTDPSDEESSDSTLAYEHSSSAATRQLTSVLQGRQELSQATSLEGAESSTWTPIPLPIALLSNLFRRLLHVSPTSTAYFASESSAPQEPIIPNCIVLVKPQSDQPNMQTNQRLREFHVHSDMLLQYTFYSWTVRTINNASSTLKRLSFRWTDTSTKTWTALLAVLSLPHLHTFEITTDLVVCKASASFDDLRQFFQRHPTIRNVVLQGVERLSEVQSIHTPILPHLTTIMAHPIWVCSLVAMIEQFPDALCNLKAIGVSTEYYQHGNFDHGSIDLALGQIASLRRTDIHLTMRFMCQNGVGEWFSSHVALGKEGSVITSLNCVSTLTISSAFFVVFGERTVQQFPEWLSLFPSLEDLKFIEMPEEQYAVFENEDFLRAIVKLSPRLRTMEVGRSVCDLQLMKEMGTNANGNHSDEDFLTPG